jgi:HEAT repeat protein
VDVAAGEYELTASVDLGDPFGLIEETHPVTVVVPSGDVLAERLEELKSEDEEARRRALIDLRYFRSEHEQVVPVLLDLLDDESERIRMVALSVLGSYREQAVRHLDLFLSILGDTEERSDSERVQAAYLIARMAPNEARYREALEAAAESAGDPRAVSFRAALAQFQRRHPKAPKAAEPEGSR